jgi:hypothetical protein
MKQLSLFSALFIGLAAPVLAVDFNTDALKSMQEEGHKIVAESQGGKSYKTRNGLCLDYAGKVLMVRKCKASGSSQTWYFDDQDRLVASDGRCVAGASLVNCGSGNNQKWRLDNQGRIAGSNNKCLQTQGNPPKNGAKIVAAGCSGAANQLWK